MKSIQDLPPEILEKILLLLRPDLHWVVGLASVCKVFRVSAFNIPVAVHIPVPDETLDVLSVNAIPVETLVNRAPAMFVGDQIRALNLRRLRSAEIDASDYLTNRGELSPHYVDVVAHLVKCSSNTLRQLVANADLVRYANGSFRCVELLCQFGNLVFLSLTFNTTAELQQKVQGRDDGKRVIRELVGRLKKLQTLYLFHCPSDKIVVRSESLERLHIYRSEFAAFEELSAPKLRSMMFQGHAREIGGQPSPSSCDRRRRPPLLEIIFDGCPKLERLNNVGLVRDEAHVVVPLCSRDVGKSAWCRRAHQMCLEKYSESLALRSMFANSA